MPATSTAKNPRGIIIEFEESSYRYSSIINNKEIKYCSGTQFLGNSYPQFAPNGGITARGANKAGVTVEDIQATSAAKGAESHRLGTRTNEVRDDVIQGNPIRN